MRERFEGLAHQLSSFDTEGRWQYLWEWGKVLSWLHCLGLSREVTLLACLALQ